MEKFLEALAGIADGLKEFAIARWNEPTTKAAIGAGCLAGFSALMAGYDIKVAVLAFIGAAGGMLCPEAKVDFDRLEPPKK